MINHTWNSKSDPWSVERQKDSTYSFLKKFYKKYFFIKKEVSYCLIELLILNLLAFSGYTCQFQKCLAVSYFLNGTR